MGDVKYPQISVTLSGSNGNAFAVLGTVRRAMKEGGVSREEQDKFMDEATSGDYDHLIQTCMKWVDVQ